MLPGYACATSREISTFGTHAVPAVAGYPATATSTKISATNATTAACAKNACTECPGVVFVATNAREMLHLKKLETSRYDRSCKSTITQVERRMRCFGTASSILRQLARDGRSEPGCGRARWNWPHSSAPVLHSRLACIQHPVCSAVQPVSPTHRAAQPVSVI